ncbi:YhdP family protein [Hydrogenophaga sp. 5NK40-0174]|uniref:YhdP family protein n=1 Tax=Hydrogenophaga sp. 5NK40-0174 TaxID=3127649 RepID=UPI00310A0440
MTQNAVVDSDDIDTYHAVPRLWRLLAGMARALLWLVVSLWVLFVLTWASIHFWIVPRVDQWRPDLERWATKALGVEVRVGSIEAHSEPVRHPWLPKFVPSMVPRMALKDVRLLDEAGREALRLPLVDTALSVRSVWRLGFEEMRIAGPVLDVRRTKGGEIEVAGLRLGGTHSEDYTVLDWFLSQRSFVIDGGELRWTDEMRDQPPLELSDLDLVIRNSTQRHDFRLDATPPPDWGERFTAVAKFREPLLELARVGRARKQPWMRWKGQAYADFTQVDVSRLRHYVDLERWKLDVRSGQGALKAWADLDMGQARRVTAQGKLSDIVTRLGPDLPDLALAEASGRLDVDWLEDGYRISTPDLRFRTQQGDAWPGGAISFEERHDKAQAEAIVRTLSADRIDLAALTNVAIRLPIDDEVRQQLESFNSRGQVQDFEGQWRTAPGKPVQYQASGRAEHLYLDEQPSAEKSEDGSRALPGRPGIDNATVVFEIGQNGGKASVALTDGKLVLPGVFEQEDMPLDALDAALRWSMKGERLDVWVDSLNLVNADAQGGGKAHWHTGDVASGKRFPGVLSVNATLSRADATAVYRYMPLGVSADARRYVQEAVRGGQAESVNFTIDGNIWDIPYSDPKVPGTFRIAAQLKNLDFQYVPSYLQSSGDKPWPALKGAKVQLLLDRDRLSLTNIVTGVENVPQVELSGGSVVLPRLKENMHVEVAARLNGPGDQLLRIVKDSPINYLTSEALDQATLTGTAQVGFDIDIPLADTARTQIQGDVRLAGNDVRIRPETPLLEKSKGVVTFSNRGFEVKKATAIAFGGEASFRGGMTVPEDGGAGILQFSGEGTATAQGLSRAGLGFASQLFSKAEGAARYNMRLGFKAGIPEFDIGTDLQGMAVNLPAPFTKRADERVAVRFINTVGNVVADAQGPVALNDRMSIDIAREDIPLARIVYLRDIVGEEAVVRRGSVAIGLRGGEEAPMPASGVLANARFDTLDMDAWERVLSSATGVDVRQAVRDSAREDAASDSGLSYLPTVMGVRAAKLVRDGRSFHDVVVGGSREGSHWRTNIDSRELNGYMEFRQPKADFAGSVYARLARLSLSPSDTDDVEELLQQPTRLPALDIAVENLTVSDRKLGRVEVEAVNQGSQWLLRRLALMVPEATLNGSGLWAFSGGDQTGPRRASLDFDLQIQDSGRLLTRFGKEGTVRGGKGRIQGTIGWLGSPFKVDYPSMSGKLRADIERGQFLKVEPGAAKLLGVLSLQSLPRRLLLDFRDVFAEGFAFDSVRGDATIEQGVIHTRNLQMRGVNAAVVMAGSADLAEETQELEVVVVPEVNAGTLSLLAATVNPVVGLGTFLAQLILREPLQSANTQVFNVTGSWADPQVVKLEKPVTATVPGGEALAPVPTAE